MFWRGSQKDLHSIEEAEEEERVEAEEREQQRQRKEGGVPPGAVAVDMGGGGSNGVEHVGAAEVPLLDHHSSPPPIKVPAAPPSDSAAGSLPASPMRLPAGARSRRPAASEAASAGTSPLGTPRHSSHHGMPMGRRLSSDSDAGLRQRPVRLPLEGLASREASVAGGRAFAQGSQAPGAGCDVGLNRAASLQSHRSVRDPPNMPKVSGQSGPVASAATTATTPQPGNGGVSAQQSPCRRSVACPQTPSCSPAPPPACLQPLLSHAASLGGASSSNSRGGSQKHIMALKMSKMEK